MNHSSDAATPVPGGLYLCQVNRTTSCGACCGLYNLANISRQSLEALLTRRTVEFAAVKRDVRSIDDFAQREKEQITHPQPYSDFHHCPFLGLVGSSGQRVGCLLHPLAHGNEGVDYRGLSYYGGLACRDYFCPTTRTLSSNVKTLLCNLDEDWYIYGLLVTEAKLNAALFQEAFKQFPEPVDVNALKKDATIFVWIKNLVTLKMNWPFRNVDKGLCHYLFEDVRPPIDYHRLNAPASRYDVILRELESSFNSRKELEEAEAYLKRLLTLPC